MHSLVVFASGAGTNTAAIIDWFSRNIKARVSMIVCNKPEAGVLNIARDKQIPYVLVNKQTIQEDMLLAQLASCHPSMIILAGFMWKLPERIVQAYNGKIVNIHPALLPAYGGKGMYGHHVHEAVIAAGEKESGITIHYVNEEYDEGNIIMQARCQVLPTDSPDDLAARIHKLEHFYYPRVIDFLLPDRV